MPEKQDHPFEGAVVNGEPVIAVRGATDDLPKAEGQPCAVCGHLKDEHKGGK